MSGRHWIFTEQRRDVYVATCECGWEGSACETADAAEVEGDRHLGAASADGSGPR